MITPGFVSQVVVRSATTAGRDAEGRPVMAWADGVTVWGTVWPVSARELVDGQWATVEGFRGILPPDCAVSHTSTVEVAGVVYRVQTAQIRSGPLGSHHMEVELVVVAP